MTTRRTRVLRVIARMNLGGPAYHVSVLSGLLDPSRYETRLVAGRVPAGEESLEDLAREYGAKLEILPTLGPDLNARSDARSFTALAAMARRFRPDIVHTHTAKAGLLGRFAAATAGWRRPIIVHTYHGHVLEGYFSKATSEVFRNLERVGGVLSDRLVAVSQPTADDLIRLKVAPAHKFRVIRLGLPIEPFLALPLPSRSAAPDDRPLTATYVGRLVPIKRIDVMLRAVAQARSAGAKIRLQIVGDGPERGELESLASALGIREAVEFLGYRRDVVDVSRRTDIGILTSDNEGTPVSLIEMAAAGRPLVATSVGGVPEVVREGTGFLAPAGDARTVGDHLRHLASNPELRQRLGATAREHVREAYQIQRLLTDVDHLYTELLAGRQRLE